MDRVHYFCSMIVFLQGHPTTELNLMFDLSIESWMFRINARVYNSHFNPFACLGILMKYGTPMLVECPMARVPSCHWDMVQWPVCIPLW